MPCTTMVQILRSSLLRVALGLATPLLANAELVIEGVDDDLESNVRAFVALADEPCDAEEWLIRRRYRALEEEAREALEPFGFYDPASEWARRHLHGLSIRFPVETLRAIRGLDVVDAWEVPIEDRERANREYQGFLFQFVRAPARTEWEVEPEGR